MKQLTNETGSVTKIYYNYDDCWHNVHNVLLHKSQIIIKNERDRPVNFDDKNQSNHYSGSSSRKNDEKKVLTMFFFSFA